MSTKIEWATETWNPVTGCTPISEGCEHCYARRMAVRLAGRCGYPKGEPFKVSLHDNQQGIPLRRRRPQQIFVCSMSDLFHEDVPDDFLDRIFAVMAMAPRHTFLVLTKRPERMRTYLTDRDRAEAIGWSEHLLYEDLNVPADYKGPTHRKLPLANVWIGVTAENQGRTDERIPILFDTPAVKRFVSIEPMLGAVDLITKQVNVEPGFFGDYLQWHHQPRDSKDQPYPGLNWVICGGETGSGARPTHPDWIRGLRDQCQDADVPFFFKSWGDWMPTYDRDREDPDWRECPKSEQGQGEYLNFEGGSGFHGTRVVFMRRTGRKTAGRILDGRTWDEYPEAENAR